LAPNLPLPAVTALYRCLLDDTMKLALSLHDVEVAIMCPASDVRDLEQVTGGTVRVVAQKGEGLAEGLRSVFARFTAAGCRRVIAFNSDSPHLPSSVLENAFDALAGSDLIVGPTHDGGFYLVGAKVSYPGLFDSDGMGTTSALDSLMARARTLHLGVRFTDRFYDIDVAADLIRLAAELRLSPESAPKTAAWLREWGHAMERLRQVEGEF